MIAGHDELLVELEKIVTADGDRVALLQRSADLIKNYGRYRWVGFYEVDRQAGVVKNVVYSGPGAPEHPTFPITKGLTAAAIAEREIVNVGNVTADPRYLTAFGSTLSEVIIPVFDLKGRDVVGTIDVESEERNAFDKDIHVLKACSKVIQPLWARMSQ